MSKSSIDAGAEHAVVLEPHAGDVIGRLGQVGGDRRPIEHGQSGEVDEVVLRGRQELVLDLRLALGVDQRLIGERIDERRLHVIDGDTLRLEPVTRDADAAAGEGGVIGFEVLAIDLLEDFGLEAEEALVLGHGREHFGVENDAVFLPARCSTCGRHR